MSTHYKHQEAFAEDLTIEWLSGERISVRKKIRTLKNKAQAAYIAAYVSHKLEHFKMSEGFTMFLHPNQKT